MMMARNSAIEQIASVSAHSRTRGDIIDTKKVRRICVSRCTAMAVPSMASHRNRIEASSSDQMIGLRNTARAMMPANRMITSATTTAAAGTSTASRSQRSTRHSRACVDGA